MGVLIAYAVYPCNELKITLWTFLALFVCSALAIWVQANLKPQTPISTV